MKQVQHYIKSLLLSVAMLLGSLMPALATDHNCAPFWSAVLGKCVVFTPNEPYEGNEQFYQGGEGDTEGREPPEPEEPEDPEGDSDTTSGTEGDDGGADASGSPK